MGFLGRDVQGTVGKAWEAVGPSRLQRHLHGIALRKATSFKIFPSSSLIFVLYCESWVREEAGES